MKKALAMLGALSPIALLAQQGTSNFDLSSAGDAATEISTQLKGLITGDVMTAALVVLGALVALWVVFKIPRWVGAGRK